MIPALVLPDGRRIELDEDVVLGRAPVAPESSPSARSISLSVPTVSKTHVLIGQDASGVWLVDLSSSNGSEVLDRAGMSERAVPGQRMAVPAGSYIRVGTDTVITVDSGTPPADDELDRTMVVRTAPVTPAPPTSADVADPTDAVDWSSVTNPDPPAPVNPEPAVSAAPPAIPPVLPPVQPPSQQPAQQPPPPQPSSLQQPPPQPFQPQQPLPPQPQPPTAVVPAVPGPFFAPGATPQQAPQQAAAADVFRPASAAVVPATGGRSVAHLIGSLLVLVWCAVGFADLRGWIPSTVEDAVDGRLLDFFFVPSQFLIEFVEFFSLITLPESLSFLSRGADIGPVVAGIVAIVSFFIPTRIVRWALATLIAIPLLLMFGVLVTLIVDQFDDFTDDIDRFIPWFVVPGVGSLLLLWPSGRSASAPTPSQDVFYAPGQPPEPPFSGPGTSPFS